MDVPSLGGQALWLGLPLIILASGLGAYTFLDHGGPCEGLTLLPASGGDAYEYAATGSVLLTSNKIIIADWNVVEGLDEQGKVTLDEGSRVAITVGPEPEPALSISGEHRPSYQVSYVASDPTRGSGLHVADEWLDEENGETNDARMPSADERSDRVLHHRHFTRTGWAGLMHAPDLWNRSLAEGDSWSISYPEGYPNTQAQSSQASVSFTVESVWESEQGCQASVQADHSFAEASLTLAEEVPVPTEYEVKVGDDGFEMALLEWERGDGSSLAPINRAEHPRSGLAPLAPLENEFLADAEGIFSTDWPAAIAAIEGDPEAQEWLDDHPNAAVTEVDLIQGDPLSDIENRWTVTWWPGPEGGASMENRVTTRSDAVSEVLDDRISVKTSYVEKAPRPEINETVTLPSLADLHEETYGVPLETFRCKFSSPPGGSKCVMAPHDDIGKPRVGGLPGAGVYFSGFVVDLRDGRVLQETSMAERLTDRPAPSG